MVKDPRTTMVYGRGITRQHDEFKQSAVRAPISKTKHDTSPTPHQLRRAVHAIAGEVDV
jgi:hypothetical protein